MPELKVTLDGEASGLTRAIDKATASVRAWSNTVDKETRDASKAFANSTRNISSSLDRASASLSRGFGKGIIAPSLYTDLRLLDKELQNVSLTANRAGKSMQVMGNSQKGSSRAARRNSAALIEVSRVLSDMPYGIRGVANNLQQLAVVSGASTTAILGITAVTAAFDFASRSIDKFIADAGGLGPALLKLTGNISAAEASLTRFNRAVGEGSAAAEGEIAQLNSLVKIIGDTNNSYDERSAALAIVVAEHKALEGAISLETIATGAAGTIIEKYAESLRVAAKAKAAAALISETYIKLVKAENASVLESANAWDFFTAALTGGATAGAGLFSVMQKGAKRNKKDLTSLNAEIERLQGYLDKLYDTASDEGTLPGQLEALLKALKEAREKAKKTVRDEVKPIESGLSEASTQSAKILTDGISGAIKEFDKGLEKSAKNFAKYFPDELLKFLNNPEGHIPSETRGIVQPDFRGPKGRIIEPKTEEPEFFGEEFAKEMEKNLNRVTQRFGQSLTNTFRDLQTTGDFTFKNILSTLGQGLNTIIGNALASIGGKAGGELGGKLASVAGDAIGGKIGGLLGKVGGPIGSAIGSVLGSLVGGLFGRGKRRREAEKQAKIQEQQLAEQQRMAKELERQSALAYTSSIIGKMLPGFGSVSNIDINSMGELTARVDGKDLLFVLGRAEGAKKRGV